uniref:BTB domain-containing protein n=1 Tax=Clastoptera arizonana TaxID=38151 RepID=A0A1B6C9Y4_9HEMI
MAGQHYCLRWNNYQSNMTSVFHQLLCTEAFVDVTLACNDDTVKAHKVVLSACSSYFQKLLLDNPCRHPTIIMPQDVCFRDLKFIIEFVYKGEIDVSQSELQSLLKTADQLKIKGLCEVPEGNNGKDMVSAEVTPLPHPPPSSVLPRRHFNKLRKLSASARRKLDTRRLYREQLQKQHLEEERRIQQEQQHQQQQQAQMIQTVVTTLHESSQQHNQIDLDQTVNVNPIRGMCTAVEISPESTQQTTVPSATLIKIQNSPTHTDMSVDTSLRSEDTDSVKVKFETLRAMEQSDHLDMDSHLSDRNLDEEPDHAMHTMMITPELLGLIPSSSVQTEINADTNGMKRENTGLGSKTWTQEDMDAALEALRSHSMSLTKASITYGIPSTTLWQRAHRLGIDTPKKDGPAKSWTEDVLNVALEALRNGTISANKASKAYGIPSSTLYKIARREGIRLAAPFNAAPTTWNPEDLERALEAIRSGQTTVQRAATEYGIPSGTLYGRCKREGIELSRSNPTPWSEDAMTEALEAVRMGQMSINQAAIHYNLPYSSLYGRFKRCKYEADHPVESEDVGLAQHHTIPQQIMLVQYQQAPTQLQMYQHTPS